MLHDGAVPPNQSRRRGAELEQAILDAAWSEIAETGWSGFSLTQVAARAGTAKPVIYRRWSNRVELAREMLDRATAGARGSVASSGDLRTDLVAFLEGMAAFLRGPFGQVARGVIYEGEQPAPSVFGDRYVVEDVRIILDRACADGQLPTAPPALVANLGHGLLMSEFLQTGTTPTGRQLTELVDSVWLPALRAAR